MKSLVLLFQEVNSNGELWQNVLGYAAGVIGLIGVSMNYFIYEKILAKGKQKYGNDILALANEIVEEQNNRDE